MMRARPTLYLKVRTCNVFWSLVRGEFHHICFPLKRGLLKLLGVICNFVRESRINFFVLIYDLINYAPMFFSLFIYAPDRMNQEKLSLGESSN